MSKYLVTTSKKVIRYISYVVEANSQEEAEENWKNGEMADEWYESSGDTYVEESEEMID
jgi:hypothetical protein